MTWMANYVNMKNVKTQISHFVIIWAPIWKCPQWIGRAKMIWDFKQNIVYGDQMMKCENRKFLPGSKFQFLYFVGPKSYSAGWG